LKVADGDGVAELVYTVVVAVTVTVWAVQGGQPVEEEEGEEVEEVLWGRVLACAESLGGLGRVGSTLRWTTWSWWCCGGGLAVDDVVC
jgi:hypothetical protein